MMTFIYGSSTKPWVKGGSIRQLNAFLIANFVLLFNRSTDSKGSPSLARNQFKIRSLCEHNVLVTFFIGANLDHVVCVTYSSKIFLPMQVIYRFKIVESLSLENKL